MQRPDLTSVNPEIVKYLEYIEELVTRQDNSSMVALYKAINGKCRDIATAIESATIDLAGDDKIFERLIKTLVESRGVAENLTFLEQKLGIESTQEDTSAKNKFKNPMENRAKQNAKAKN